MARVLIVGGGCRGRGLAAELLAHGHAVRVTSRTPAGRPAIEALGAESWVGTPDRLETLRGSLDRVAVACWMMGTASGPEAELEALHTTRLELFLTQAVDTTVRGLVYEAGGDGGPSAAREAGEQIVLRLTERNRIPAVLLREDPRAPEQWASAALAAVESFLAV